MMWARLIVGIDIKITVAMGREQNGKRKCSRQAAMLY